MQAGAPPDDTLKVFTFALGGAGIDAPPSGGGGTYPDFGCFDPPPLGEALGEVPPPPSFFANAKNPPPSAFFSFFSSAGFVGTYSAEPEPAVFSFPFSTLGLEDSDQHA